MFYLLRNFVGGSRKEDKGKIPRKDPDLREPINSRIFSKNSNI